MTQPIKVELTLDLDRHIHDGYRQTGEDDYEPVTTTVETLIIQEAARQLLTGATTHRAPDVRAELRRRVETIRDEAIRERVVPLVEEALAGPLRRTNAYGEPHGPETTLRALVVEEATNILNRASHNSDGFSSRNNKSLVESLVAAEVGAAFAKELKAAIGAAKAEAVAVVQAQAAQILAETIQRAADVL